MSEKTNLDKVKDKLRKLMNHEESARTLGNEEEANAFAAKIQSLMLTYEIEVHEMREHSLVSETEEVGEENIDLKETAGRHESTWLVFLYHGVAKYNFCEVVMRGKITDQRIILVGEAMNREVVHYICNQLVTTFRQLSRNYFKTYDGPEKRNTYIRGFLKGAANGLTSKLREEHDAAKSDQGAQVHGIILAKDHKLADWMSQRFGQMGHASSGRRGKGYAGQNAGHTAGRNASYSRGNEGRGSSGGGYLNE